MASKQNFPKVVTPKGVGIYPRLNAPDTKYNAAGVYETKLAFDADTPGLSKLQEKVSALIDAKHDEVVAELTEACKVCLEKTIGRRSTFRPEYDPAPGEATSRITSKAKTTATDVTKPTSKEHRPNQTPKRKDA